MKGSAAVSRLPVIAKAAYKGQVCWGVVVVVLSLVLLELGSWHRHPTWIQLNLHTSSSSSRLSSLGLLHPQGPDPSLWPPRAQQFLAVLEAALARYFPAEMPNDDNEKNNNKQKYIKTHLPRFMHSLIRAAPHIKTGAAIVALGEKGHVPALLHELFKPSLLKVTTMEFPGIMQLRDSLSNKTVAVSLVQHDAETEPLPFQSESIDHVFFLEVLEHLSMDPFFAILEMHRVLRFNGTLFLSTPNLGSFSSLARLHDGWSPYSFSKYLSNSEGEGNITHVREYTWKELQIFMEAAGFEPDMQCFSTYAGDKEFWDFAAGRPQARYEGLLRALPRQQQTLDVLGSTAFIIAKKVRLPYTRRPYQLYAYAKEFKFDGYPVCKSSKHKQLCARAGDAKATGSSTARPAASAKD